MTDKPTPTPAPTEDARWLSPETRSRTEVDNNLGPLPYSLTIQRLLNHATLMDERLKQSEERFEETIRLAELQYKLVTDRAEKDESQIAAHSEETRSYEAYIAKLNDQIAAKDRDIAELRRYRERLDWLQSSLQQAEAQIAAKDREIAELRRDRERLDWLAMASPDQLAPMLPVLISERAKQCDPGVWREAIDAAKGKS